MKGVFNYSLVVFVFGATAATLPCGVHSFLAREKVPLGGGKKTFTTTTTDGAKHKHEHKVKYKLGTRREASLYLDQYAPAAAALFGNMITPASILGGAIVPIAFASGLDFVGDKDESKFAKFLRKMFPFVSVTSLGSLLVSVLWSSIMVNQLTENNPAVAASVWDLLQRDYALPWAAVNSHFVLGMLGFMWLIATKAFFMAGGATPIFTLAMSAMTMMVSIVNRGVASGGGRETHRFGSSIVGLVSSYLSMLVRRSKTSFGPLECLAAGLFFVSCSSYAKFVWNQIEKS
mmetsp:Transcript_25952/g.54320  ORF Transcript_25952/g.54320 Transcript_25952/m.54320 type:complete len:289 (-) Transcript_25952:2317-3183(-)